MSGTQAQRDIREMHAAYVAGSGIQITLDYAREEAWFHVWRRGVRAKDITDLIADNRRKVRLGIPARSLLFRNFVGSADFLEEDLAELRARDRVPKRDPAKVSVLRATGRPAAPEPPQGKPVGEVISGEEMARRLKEWRVGEGL
jgi:hypothetical protein